MAENPEQKIAGNSTYFILLLNHPEAINYSSYLKVAKNKTKQKPTGQKFVFYETEISSVKSDIYTAQESGNKREALNNMHPISPRLNFQQKLEQKQMSNTFFFCKIM